MRPNFGNLVGVNVLSPFGIAYGRIMDVRNRLYDSGKLRSHSLGAKTISIGNLTTGGTGKTPLVALVAEILAAEGEKVCILTRGYGRTDPKKRVLVSDGVKLLVDAATGGDEPVELAGKLLGKALVVADADRVAAAAWVREKFGITAFVLDDGFQHRRAKRDVDIVCIDATNPCGNGLMLPAGDLRESFSGLRRADAIVITRADLVESTDELAERLIRRNATAPIFLASTSITEIVGLNDLFATSSVQPADVERVFAFCGLGNPGNFRRQLEIENFELAGFRSFGDHHKYSQADIELLIIEAKMAGATSLMTTVKDGVKLKHLNFEMPVFIARIEMRIDAEEQFRKLVIG